MVLNLHNQHSVMANITSQCLDATTRIGSSLFSDIVEALEQGKLKTMVWKLPEGDEAYAMMVAAMNKKMRR